jgi:uncharacterized protein (DUF169 family)
LQLPDGVIGAKRTIAAQSRQGKQKAQKTRKKCGFRIAAVSDTRPVIFLPVIFLCKTGGNVMADWQEMERRFTGKLPMQRRPVAVAFLDSPPKGVPAFSGTEPSGCSYWRLAAEGRVFYTVPSDHFNCAIGSYTHNIPLSPEREKETEQTLGLMFQAGYIRPEEVAGIPRLAKTPAAIVYAPLAASPVEPSAVLFACKPATAMLLHEAAIRAGSGSAAPALGRPTCMGLPLALTGGTQISLGCIGNRVYTGLGEDEMYVVVPEKDLQKVSSALETIVAANHALEDYARGRRKELATA